MLFRALPTGYDITSSQQTKLHSHLHSEDHVHVSVCVYGTTLDQPQCPSRVIFCGKGGGVM